MLPAKAPCRTACAHVAPIVVVICDVEVAGVEVSEGRIVAHEGRLPVVVEVVPRDCDKV